MGDPERARPDLVRASKLCEYDEKTPEIPRNFMYAFLCSTTASYLCLIGEDMSKSIGTLFLRFLPLSFSLSETVCTRC